jgi:uncharacterized membrane protein
VNLNRTVVQSNVTVGVYDTPNDAVTAVTALRNSGSDLRKLSVVAKDNRNGKVVGYYQSDNGIKYWGTLSDFWGTLWGLLSGWAFFVIPGIGPILVAGPLSNWIVAALKNAAIFGSLSSLSAALYSLGISKDTVLKYEAAIKANKLLVVAYGTAAEVDKVRTILHAEDAAESAA